MKENRFSEALTTLALLGRDEDAAKLAATLVDQKPDQFTPRPQPPRSAPLPHRAADLIFKAYDVAVTGRLLPPRPADAKDSDPKDAPKEAAPNDATAKDVARRPPRQARQLQRLLARCALARRLPRSLRPRPTASCSSRSRMRLRVDNFERDCDELAAAWARASSKASAAAMLTEVVGAAPTQDLKTKATVVLEVPDALTRPRHTTRGSVHTGPRAASSFFSSALAGSGGASSSCRPSPSLLNPTLGLRTPVSNRISAISPGVVYRSVPSIRYRASDAPNTGSVAATYRGKADLLRPVPPQRGLRRARPLEHLTPLQRRAVSHVPQRQSLLVGVLRVQREGQHQTLLAPLGDPRIHHLQIRRPRPTSTAPDAPQDPKASRGRHGHRPPHPPPAP